MVNKFVGSTIYNVAKQAFKKNLNPGKAIKSVKTNVPDTETKKLAARLKVLETKRKSADKMLEQTNFEIANPEFAKGKFTFDPARKNVPKKSDIKSAFAGLRPLAATSNKKSTKEVSRSHKIDIAPSGLISVLGGKWTTYRKIAEDAINAAISINRLKKKKCKTEKFKLDGYKKIVDPLFFLRLSLSLNVKP